MTDPVDKKTSDEDLAETLDGTEEVRISQSVGGTLMSRRTALSAIAALAVGSKISINEMDAFGDSITVGYGASDTAHDYISLLNTALNVTITNQAVSNSCVGDQANIVYGKTVDSTSNSILMLGTNDMRTYQGVAGGRAAYRMGIAALIAWLAIPDGNKHLAKDAILSGTWSAGTPSFSRYATGAAGATCTFNKVRGTSIYLVSTVITSAGAGTYTITIDGKIYGTYTALPGGNANVSTPLGAIVVPVLHRFSGLDAGEHTVVVTTTGSVDPVVVQWCAGNADCRTPTGPNVWVGNTPRMDATGYAGAGGSDADVHAYGLMVKQAVTALAQDGLNVVLVDVEGALDNVSGSDLGPDHIHPSDQGYAKIATCFLTEITNSGALQMPIRTIGDRLPFLSTTVAYTLGLEDVNRRIETTNASASGITVPRHMSFPCEIGTIIPLRQTGAGVCAVTPAAGVTITGTPGLRTRSQYSMIAIIKVNADEWQAVGDSQA